MITKICVLTAVMLAFSSCAYIEKAKTVVVPIAEKKIDQGIENSTAVLCRLPVTALVRNARKRGDRWLAGMALICPESIGVLLGANK